MNKRTFLPTTILLATIAVTLTTTAGAAPAPKPAWSSKVLRHDNRTAKVDVDVTGAKQLVLIANDGGDGYSHDWAAWIEPKLIGPRGAVKLTSLKWKSATSDWGGVKVNANCEGRPIKVQDKTYDDGIGTHAQSVIVYDIAGKGFTKFQATAALDDGGVGRSHDTSIQFQVYTELSAKLLAAIKKPRSSSKGGLPAEEALAALDVADGVEAELFASEPILLNPTNIDIDARGRVWACEVINYRGRKNSRAEGDRILILEDTDGDGKADKTKVYYQGRDVDSALGICVLGNKVIVSCSPNVLVFTDTNGDDKPDSKEVLFSGISGAQHDHTVHAFLFGPDGKLYFNFGNVGRQLKNPKTDKVIVDMAGNEVAANGKPYRQGMVFRCNLDGSELETLGHNFRNNYEVTVDSFGTLWQSDNDDDGNRGVRINYVMEFGNFGYTDERTGAGWRSQRTNMAADTPSRHWYQNDPGVVPNLLHTGAGSPTGICVYEGNLLPKAFHNQIIHCDAGPNICRAYPVTDDGAGYKAETLDLLFGARDNWYRPSDVCVAPDGSVFVADWYDPGVGGHGMGDVDKGRIFRLAPANTPYKTAKLDVTTPAGAVKALLSPNSATRYIGWTALNKMQGKAETALQDVWKNSSNPRHRSRALHLLARIDGKAQQYVHEASKDKEPNLRLTAVRIARERKLDVIPLVKSLVNDSSPQVRRECAIALRHHKSSNAPALWAELAAQHDGADRWYLEALGIGADRQSDLYFAAWLTKVGNKWNTPGGRDIIWRSRSKQAPAYLAKILLDKGTADEEKPRYMRAFDFHTGPEKDAALKSLLGL